MSCGVEPVRGDLEAGGGQLGQQALLGSEVAAGDAVADLAARHRIEGKHSGWRRVARQAHHDQRAAGGQHAPGLGQAARTVAQHDAVQQVAIHDRIEVAIRPRQSQHAALAQLQLDALALRRQSHGQRHDVYAADGERQLTRQPHRDAAVAAAQLQQPPRLRHARQRQCAPDLCQRVRHQHIV